MKTIVGLCESNGKLLGDFIPVTSAITNWSKIRRTGERHGALEREVAHRTLVDTHWHMEAKETEIRTLAPTNTQFLHKTHL